MKLIAVTVSLAFLACQSPASGPSAHKGDSVVPAAAVTKGPPDSTTLGGSWFLQPVLAADTASGKTPILQLDLNKSRFTGNTGCNTMRGQFWYSGKDSSLSFSDKIITTKIACPGYNEPAFMKSLKSATHYRLRNGVMTLLSDDRTELSRWMRKPATAPKALKA
ncbi:META domain-containing protein [Puia sp.]|jgi:heat shock protein HslJ|uniref:META domain-containing protein n=1 Tax=Puia sp. TaxID=2045100 RepID=UPI002F406673